MAGIGLIEIIILLIFFGLYTLGVVFCSKTAQKFNRNNITWIILGIINPVIALILLNILGRKNN